MAGELTTRVKLDLPTQVYPCFYIDLKELTTSIQALFKADRVRRPDEVQKYLESRIEADGKQINVDRTDMGFSIKMKLRHKPTDQLFWYEWRIPLK